MKQNKCDIQDPRCCTGEEIHRCKYYTPEDMHYYNVCIDCCIYDSMQVGP